MRRWAALFFLLLFPLQAVWAAAAPYCQHEKAPSTFHIGHHDHQHEAGGADSDPQGKSLPGMDDVDCHGCHAFCGAMVTASRANDAPFGPSSPSEARPVAWPTPPQAEPERPNWFALA